MTFRAGVFGETVSTFLTAKERTCFSTTGSALTVSIEAGTLDAIVYVVLHEATHIVDDSLRFTPGTFSAGVWSGRTTAASAYRDSLLESIHFRTGESLPIDRAEAVYAALQKTPFVSLYASSNWFDDLAESVTWYDLSTKKAQPFRIVIRRADNEIFSYEPLKSPNVRARFARLGQFFEGGG